MNNGYNKARFYVFIYLQRHKNGFLHCKSNGNASSCTFALKNQSTFSFYSLFTVLNVVIEISKLEPLSISNSSRICPEMQVLFYFIFDYFIKAEADFGGVKL